MALRAPGDPVKTVSVLSKSLPAVDTVTSPSEVGVKAYHTVEPSGKQIMSSPADVAPTVLMASLNGSPLITVAVVASSLGGAAACAGAVSSNSAPAIAAHARDTRNTLSSNAATATTRRARRQLRFVRADT